MLSKKYLSFLFTFALLLPACITGMTDTGKPLTLYKQTVYTSQDGLPQNSVFKIVQTPGGFIWLATDSGLARFDGVDFDVYNLENTPALSDDVIRSLSVDNRGVLWIATEHGGIISYAGGVFKTMYTAANGLESNSTRAILPSADGSLWFGSDGGLNHLEKGTLCTIPFPESAVSRSVHALAEDSKARLWIGTSDGLLKLTRKEREYIVTQAGFFGDHITSLAVDGEDNLWVGTNGKGIIRQQADGNRDVSFTTANGLSSNLIDSLYIDKDGALLIATRGGGLNRVHGKDVSVFGTAEGLSHNFATAVLRDREGNIWIGTNGGGLNLLTDSKITVYNTRSGLSFFQVYGIYQDRRGRVWVGTFGFGINCIKDGRVIKTYTTADGLPANFIVSICEDRAGNMWFGTFGGGVARMKNGHFKTFDLNDGLINNFVYGLYVDSKGTLWAGTNQGGLHTFVNGRFELFDRFEGKVRTFLEDSRDNLWVGTDTVGLIRIKNGKTRLFNENHGLSSHDIMCIYEDKAGIIWAATFGGGVNRYSEKSGRFEPVRRKDGLPHDIIFWILEDDSGHLWLSSMNGIFRVRHRELEDFFTGKSGKITGTTFDEADGMDVRESNGGTHPAGWRTSDGRLWFITAAGVAVVDPSDTKPHALPHTIAVKQVIINGKTYLPQPKIDVPPGKGDIDIKYTAPTFTVPERVLFEYILDGYDEDWIDAGTRREAFYTNISYGTYNFRVRTHSREGSGSEKEASLKLYIAPHIWQTWWFRILAIILAVSLILFIFFSTMRRVRQKQQILENLVAERTGNLRSKTIELENKRAALEKTNTIVKSINAAVDYKDILGSILKETASLEGIHHALALVYDKPIDSYTFRAALGYDVNRLAPIRLSFTEVEGRYIAGAEEISKDIFIVKNISGRPGEDKVKPFAIPQSMLVLKIRSEDTAAGYLIFEDMKEKDAFERKEIRLLEELKDHIAAAFIKSKLLLELEAEREAAEAANYSKSMFLARMSHEIRTPMNSVIGFAEMLKDTKLNAEQKEFTHNIAKSGEVLLHLIDEILDFSKIEAGRFVLETVDFNVKTTVYEVCRIIKPRLGDRPVEILCRCDGQIPPYVHGDGGRFRQVLLNLMGNAVKFTHEGEIDVSVSIDEETDRLITLQTRIRDTGIGIPGEQLQSIFEQFQQADGSITRKYGGTGLGLAISKQIALLMGGDIRVESEVGKGSTFHFTARLEKSSKEPVPEEKIDAVEKDRKNGKRWQADGGKQPLNILLAEDNPVNRKLAVFMLTKGGYRVDVVMNGKEAVETFSANPAKYDLIFMDVNMPEMDGIEAARMIRKKGFADVPIIAMTAHALKEDRQNCLQAGMNDYISKPIKQEVVFNMIQKCTRRVPTLGT